MGNIRPNTMRNKPRWLVFWLMLWGMVGELVAQDLRCDLCAQPLHGRYFIIEDRAEGGKRNFCRECSELEERCFACGLPVRRSARKLPDGRWLCERDAAASVDEAAAKTVCDGVRNDLDRLYSRFLTLPSENVVLSMVDKIHLESLFKSPGYERSCVSIFGATQSQPLPGKHFIHSISILSDLKKSRLMAVAAHEFTHAWMGENVRPERKASLSPDTVEGFCELVAYRLLETKHEEFEIQVIKSSEYTRGQFAVLLEAESLYGFNAVLEWIKNGEDAALDSGNLDRLRAVVNSTPASPRAIAAPAAYQVQAQAQVTPPTIPSTLKLKAISGPAQRRLAIINDATFEVMEKGKVHVGGTSVLIQCLEIRKDSVLIQIEGARTRKELVLGAD